MNHEAWVDISEFPDYAVSNHGRVMNKHTEMIKTPTPNQQGIPSVLLMRDRVQFRRSIAPLVAYHFLVPHKNPRFDTPINLDGDRLNNHWENLVWRPRWFAHRYHAQFRKTPPYGFKTGVFCTQDDKTFPNLLEAAAHYGMLMEDILRSTHTQQPVFPTWQVFGVWSPDS